MINNRITNPNITSLNNNEIFVFGDNESHIHGKGAAKTAMRFGAKYGIGGFCGQTYGIPTVDKTIKYKLSINKIKKCVDEFIEFTKTKPELTFLVTEIGCGLAGHNVEDIAPLFKSVINIGNIHLPARFWKLLTN